MRLPYLLCSLALLAACGNDGPGTGPVTAADAEAGCRRTCEHDKTCNPTSTQTVEECTADCVADVSGWVRADAFEIVIDCMAELACGVSDDLCVTECTPTSAHERFEAQCRTTMAACGDPAEVTAFCETTPNGDEIGYYCLMTPAILDELTACVPAGATCTAASACVQGVLEARVSG